MYRASNKALSGFKYPNDICFFYFKELDSLPKRELHNAFHS